MDFNFLQRPRLEFHQDGIVSLQLRHSDQVQVQEHEEEEVVVKVEIEDAEEEECKCTVSSAESTRPEVSLREFNARNDNYDDDDDGFKTPTSLDHKIPVIKQCPPAPRKPNVLSSRKRKPSTSQTSNARRNLRLDLHEEVESLFPRNILADLYNKIKKARRDDDTAPVN